MGTDLPAAFQYQPIGGDEEGEAGHQPGDDPVDPCVEAHDAGENDFFQLLIADGHDSLLEVIEKSAQQPALRLAVDSCEVEEQRRVPKKGEQPPAYKADHGPVEGPDEASVR